MRSNHKIKRGVSLYSYQDNIYFRKLDLDGCLAAVAGTGAEGVEIMAEMLLREFPFVSDAFVDRWHGLMERYGLSPVCVDHFADRAMWKTKQLTDDEMLEYSIRYIKTAAKLGCPYIRLLHTDHIGRKISPFNLVDEILTEKLLPVCAEYGVTMALEIHAPTQIDDPIHELYLEAAERTGLPYVKLQADMTICNRTDSRAVVERYIRNGGTDEVIYYLRKIGDLKYAGEHVDHAEVEEKLKSMKANDIDREYWRMVSYRRKSTTMETLKRYAPQICYVHAKLNYIDENLMCEEIDYPAAIKALKDGGYEGYISTEFEGNRQMNDAGFVDEIEFVRLHQKLIERELGY